MPYPILQHPEPLPLQQASADLYLLRRHSQLCLSLCGVSGSWCVQGMFELSEHLWQIWGLILNVILPLLLSCWDFSFALGHGISPQSCSSPVKSPLQRLPSCWVFSTLGYGVFPHNCSSAAKPSLQHLECSGISGRSIGWQCPVVGLGSLSVPVQDRKSVV